MKRETSLLGPGRGGLAALALLGGLAWAWVDSRPTWDDTGISALVVALIPAALGAVVGALVRRAVGAGTHSAA